MACINVSLYVFCKFIEYSVDRTIEPFKFYTTIQINEKKNMENTLFLENL